MVEALVVQGCRHVFGLPGSHTLELYGALARRQEIRHVTVKSESNVSFMADFYGRLTGQPGVSILTAGPGALNSVNGVAQAFSAHSPMIHITGAVPVDATLEAFHGVDDPEFVRKMFEPITKWSVRVTDAASVPEVMAEAYRVALSGRPGPVHLEFPRLSDTSHNLITDSAVDIPPYGSPVEIPPIFDPDEINALLRRLQGVHHPLIIAGKGVIRAGAGEWVGEIASALGAPIVYDQEAIGVVPDDHPLSVGYLSIWSLQPFIEQLLEQADIVLGIGVRPGTGVGNMLQRTSGDRLIYVDWVAGNGHETLVAGNIRAILQEMRAHISPVSPEGRVSLEREIASYRAGVEQERRQLIADAEGSPGVHPGKVISVLAELIAERSATVVSDIGDCAVWLRNYLPNRSNQTLLQSGMWGSMGCALPGAFVSSLVNPERLAVGVVGDGAFFMSMGDLGTILEHETNPILIVLNDGKYQQISRALQRTDQTEYGTHFVNPDFVALVESFGGCGFRVSTEDALIEALQMALKAEKLTVLDVHIPVGCPYPSFEFNTRNASKP